MSFITTSAKEVTTSIRHGRQGVVSFVTMSGKEITADPTWSPGGGVVRDKKWQGDVIRDNDC